MFDKPPPSSATTRPVITPVCAFAIRGMTQKKRKRQRDRETEGRRDKETERRRERETERERDRETERRGGGATERIFALSVSLSLCLSVPPSLRLLVSLSLRWIISQTSQSVPPRAGRASIRPQPSRLPRLFSTSPARWRPRRPAPAGDRSARHQARRGASASICPERCC